jgi:excisionase family DNA binding protein
MLDEYFSLPIIEFCRRTGLGTTLCREMIKDGRLRAIRVGRKLLIDVSSWREFVERQALEGVPEDNETAKAIAASLEARRVKREARKADLEDLGLV